MSETPKNFHLPLPENLYDSLKEMSRQLNMSITKIAKQTLEKSVRQWEKEIRHQQIVQFAEQFGGTEYDLDPALENASIESLTDNGDDVDGPSL